MTNETITNNGTEKKEGINLTEELVKTGIVATASGVKQMADIKLWAIGLGAGLLFGRKAGLKTIGTVVGVGTIWNTARYISGEIDPFKEKPEE